MWNPGNVDERQRIGYTGRLRAFEAAFETDLRALGSDTINSTPAHPQTCGKIERFWQTLKKVVTRPLGRSHLEELNELLASSATTTTTNGLTGPARSYAAQAFIATKKPAPLSGRCTQRCSSADAP